MPGTVGQTGQATREAMSDVGTIVQRVVAVPLLSLCFPRSRTHGIHCPSNHLFMTVERANKHEVVTLFCPWATCMQQGMTQPSKAGRLHTSA
jgi:hypothetical protein